MKKFLPIAMAAVMSMSAVAVSAVSANAVEPLNAPVQYAQVARASLATPKISKAESVYGGVKLTWNKVNGAAKYRVYYKGRKGWTRMVDTTSTSYIDKDVSSGRNYTYTVRCITSDAKKFTSGYNPTGKSVKYVATPKISKLEVTYDGVKLTWNKVAGAEKYRVYYKDRNGWTKLADTTGTTMLDMNVVSKEFDLSIDDNGLGRIEKYPMTPTMKVQYLLKQWNDSGNELVITQNAYWRTKYIEPETTEISVSFMEYDYLVQSLGDQALDQIIIKREKAGISG